MPLTHAPPPLLLPGVFIAMRADVWERLRHPKPCGLRDEIRKRTLDILLIGGAPPEPLLMTRHRYARWEGEALCIDRRDTSPACLLDASDVDTEAVPWSLEKNAC